MVQVGSSGRERKAGRKGGGGKGGDAEGMWNACKCREGWCGLSKVLMVLSVTHRTGAARTHAAVFEKYGHPEQEALPVELCLGQTEKSVQLNGHQPWGLGICVKVCAPHQCLALRIPPSTITCHSLLMSCCVRASRAFDLQVCRVRPRWASAATGRRGHVARSLGSLEIRGGWSGVTSMRRLDLCIRARSECCVLASCCDPCSSFDCPSSATTPASEQWGRGKGKEGSRGSRFSQSLFLSHICPVDCQTLIICALWPCTLLTTLLVHSVPTQPHGRLGLVLGGGPLGLRVLSPVCQTVLLHWQSRPRREPHFSRAPNGGRGAPRAGPSAHPPTPPPARKLTRAKQMHAVSVILLGLLNALLLCTPSRMTHFCHLLPRMVFQALQEAKKKEAAAAAAAAAALEAASAVSSSVPPASSASLPEAAGAPSPASSAAPAPTPSSLSSTVSAPASPEKRQPCGATAAPPKGGEPPKEVAKKEADHEAIVVELAPAMEIEKAPAPAVKPEAPAAEAKKAEETAAPAGTSGAVDGQASVPPRKPASPKNSTSPKKRASKTKKGRVSEDESTSASSGSSESDSESGSSSDEESSSAGSDSDASSSVSSSSGSESERRKKKHDKARKASRKEKKKDKVRASRDDENASEGEEKRQKMAGKKHARASAAAESKMPVLGERRRKSKSVLSDVRCNSTNLYFSLTSHRYSSMEAEHKVTPEEMEEYQRTRTRHEDPMANYVDEEDKQKR